jgi:SAM-dependent methyltransferase
MSNNHLGGCVIDNNTSGDIGTYAPQVWDKLIELYNPKTILDVGCGAGYSLKYFMDKGIDGIGIEGYREAIQRSPIKGNLIEHDYTKGEYIPASNFDLAWSCEFVEHVEEQYLHNFMKSFNACKYVAITHAVPGQPGFHHVNCQPKEYWIDIFRSYEFEYLEDISLMLRSLLYDENGGSLENGSHVRNTLMIFKK